MVYGLQSGNLEIAKKKLEEVRNCVIGMPQSVSLTIERSAFEHNVRSETEASSS